MARKKTDENIEVVNLHKEHRKRMDKRYLKTGFTGWSDYEILEYMLYATISRGNTSEQAHLLMEKFGTLDNVITADINELTKIKGIGKASARHLNTLFEFHEHLNEKNSDVPRKFNLTTEKTLQYVRRQFNGKTEEMVIMICLDINDRLIKTETLSVGTFHHAELDITRATRIAVGSNAAKVIIAHNHPSGSAVPSENDIHTTEWLSMSLSACGITVLEHIIVAKDKVGLVNKYKKTGNPYPDPQKPVQMKTYNKKG